MSLLMGSLGSRRSSFSRVEPVAGILCDGLGRKHKRFRWPLKDSQFNHTRDLNVELLERVCDRVRALREIVELDWDF